MPYTTVVAGTVITASWGNMVRDQLVTPFADAATRTAQVTAPVEGMLSYLTDIDQFGYHNGTSYCPMAGQIIARGNRTTSSGTTTSEVGVLRLDDVPLIAGQLYLIMTSSLALNSTTSGDAIGGTLRYTTDGSTPNATSSARLASVHALAGSSSPALPLVAKFVPASNLAFSVVLTVVRWSGSGTVSMIADANHPDIDLMIISSGAAPADTGTDI
jgi:hypothetical protein